MALRIREQNIAVFGESGSGKTVLVSSFFGATQEPTFDGRSLYKVLADETSQGTRLRQNYLKMKNTAKVPSTNRFAATSYSFTVRPNSGDGAKVHPFNAIRLVWHDYPGEWFTEDPGNEQEARRRIETFTTLLKSDVALVLVDGQKLVEYAGQEEKYLKSLFWGMRDELEKLKQDILVDERPLAEFPRIWVISLSKADLHPELSVQEFNDLIIEKAADDVAAFHDTLKSFVEMPEALSFGEDFMLLSSAKFEPRRIVVTQRVGVDLILPVASMLPLERLAQWADRLDAPVKVLGPLVDNSEELASVLTTGAQFAVQLLAKVPKVGPTLARYALPAVEALVEQSTANIQELYAQALEDKDYLAATLTQFRLDLDRGVERELLAKSPW